MSVLLEVVGVVLLLPGLMAAAHLALLTTAALFYREWRPLGTAPPVRFLIMVPAHDEEAVIGPTLAALDRARRLGDHVLVVADRCTDRTAELARNAGAEVFERVPGQQPGRAAARQDGLEHALTLDWDAIVMIDADSIVEPDFFAACEQQLASGAGVLQARSEAASGAGLIAQAYLAAFAVQGVTIPRGRDRLGLSVRLRGTGMVLRRSLVSQARFRSPASEDLFYGLDLCLQGVHPRHVESARLRSANVGTWRAASDQRVRYETGRILAGREFLPALLRRHSAASLDAACHLASPPLALAVLLLLLAAACFAAAGAVVLAMIGLLGLGLITYSVLVALILARAPLRTWLALLAVPCYLVWKLPVQLKALLLVRRRRVHFAGTPRT